MLGQLRENRICVAILALALALVWVHFSDLTAKPNFDRVLDSVVIIRVDGKNSGTGFFITDDGCVMTAAHVVADAVVKKKKIGVVLRGSRTEYEATPVAGNIQLDIAVVCSSARRPPLKIVFTEGLKPGDYVWVVGHPMSRSWNLTQGVVSRMAYKVHTTGGVPIPRFDLFTTAFISWGNSGGPLIDRHGNVVGMIVEWDDPGIGKPNSSNVAVPGTDLIRFVRSLWGK